ncbi:MAG: S8 family serine peptidase, partial [Bacteroidales bacterium]|nr:S8 family serine peptidase [Bacteroidales bacterium]
MTKVLFIAVSMLVTSFLFSQELSSVYIIKFSDKSNTGYSIDQPGLFLSERAVERRERFGIPVKESDLPISHDYLRLIIDQGSQLIVKSKWLNLVIVNNDNPDKIKSISKLFFVKEVIKADYLLTKLPEYSNNEQSLNKPFFRNETYSNQPLSPRMLKSSDAIMEFNYGISFNQIDMLNGIPLHNEGFTGEGMVIAVLDAGFRNVDQMAAFDTLWSNDRILGTRDYVEPGNDVFNDAIHTHGMMVLSAMGGNLPGELVGTAPHAGYYLIRTEDATAEYLMEEYFWVQGAEYADSLGVDIINSSLGYTVFDDPLENHTYEDMDGNTTPITIGADMAAEKGILVCNSAGNWANDPWLYIGAPADGDSVFTIGAVDSIGNWAGFSSIGPTFDGRLKPNVVAQGKLAVIAHPSGGISQGSGTSFSSPIIAGMTACLWQANPDFNNMEIMQAIQQSANRYDNPNDSLGYGIPDYEAANNILGINEVALTENQMVVRVSPNPFNESLFL